MLKNEKRSSEYHIDSIELRYSAAIGDKSSNSVIFYEKINKIYQISYIKLNLLYEQQFVVSPLCL